jgi:hypothetical protein
MKTLVYHSPFIGKWVLEKNGTPYHEFETKEQAEKAERDLHINHVFSADLEDRQRARDGRIY